MDGPRMIHGRSMGNAYMALSLLALWGSLGPQILGFTLGSLVVHPFVLFNTLGFFPLIIRHSPAPSVCKQDRGWLSGTQGSGRQLQCVAHSRASSATCPMLLLCQHALMVHALVTLQKKRTCKYATTWTPKSQPSPSLRYPEWAIGHQGQQEGTPRTNVSKKRPPPKESPAKFCNAFGGD